jgi:subtilisin family serine protease
MGFRLAGARALFAGGVSLLSMVAAADARPIAGDPLYAGNAALGKVTRSLLAAGQTTGGAAASAAGVAVEVDVRLNRLTPEIEARAQELGLDLSHADYAHARLAGSCPPSALPALAEIAEVAVIHPNYGAQTMSGTVNSQGDVSIGAAATRAAFAVDGRGVRVGILSDTFLSTSRGDIAGAGCNRRMTNSQPQQSGEIPSSIVLLDAGRNSPNFGSDEGRAMAEIVHDLAPGADLLFHSAFSTMSVFADGIDALVDCGADIIVDDVIYFAEPMFQDGIIAQAAQRAVDRGVPFFSAIGNLSTFGVDETYQDFSPVDDMSDQPSGLDLHVFANGSRFAAVELPPSCGVRLVLQWNEPFSGVLGRGARTDLDLYSCTAEDPSSCAGDNDSINPQGCSFGEGNIPSGDPLEILRIRNSSSQPTTRYIAVEHVCGKKDLRFRIAAFAEGCIYPEGYTFDPQVFHSMQAYGHPAAAGVIAVAASFYGEIDSNGTHTAPAERIDVEGFSSLGGDVPIYFDGSGDPLPGAPQLRRKPEITGPDGTNTSFFGLRDEESDGYRNFFGTSAAAPHAAAVAALMLQRRPDLTPASVLQILRETAEDIVDPGDDFRSGAGLIDAFAAMELVNELPTPTAPATATPTPTASPTASEPPTATATSRPGTCPGDCDGDGEVTVAELVRGVRIALGRDGIADCASLDQDLSGTASIAELVRAAAAALSGCA